MTPIVVPDYATGFEHGTLDPRRGTSGPSIALSAGKAAEYLGVSVASIRRWSDAGRLYCFRTPGGQRRFYPAVLDAFFAAGAAGPNSDGRIEVEFDRIRVEVVEVVGSCVRVEVSLFDGRTEVLSIPADDRLQPGDSLVALLGAKARGPLIRVT